jgi:hypothetical protein
VIPQATVVDSTSSTSSKPAENTEDVEGRAPSPPTRRLAVKELRRIAAEALALADILDEKKRNEEKTEDNGGQK